MNDTTSELPSTRPARCLADTRARILAAARTCFARNNYESVGIRDIAGAASVDPALVCRYFGSKEKLFAEVVTGAFCLEQHMANDLDAARQQVPDLGYRMARSLLADNSECSAEDCDALQLLLSSAASPTTASVVSDGFHSEFLQPLAKLLPGPDAQMRAGLISAYIIGILTLREALNSPSMVAADRDKIIPLLGAAIQACLDAPADTTSK
ncbi:TetR family transcriptional regulator [Arenimonas sp.]|uniref:TetR/AcrR family transcriptional regulator n=1 Tax=Arenimonas sp. TaxID=1872635 RepID=UPI0039E6814F